MITHVGYRIPWSAARTGRRASSEALHTPLETKESTVLKIGNKVIHTMDNPKFPLGVGRVMRIQKGAGRALIQWSTGQVSEHVVHCLEVIPNK